MSSCPWRGLIFLSVAGEFDTQYEVFTPSTPTHAMTILLVPTDMNENDEHAATQILLYTDVPSYFYGCSG
jgi:hypothetical protein